MRKLSYRESAGERKRALAKMIKEERCCYQTQNSQSTLSWWHVEITHTCRHMRSRKYFKMPLTLVALFPVSATNLFHSSVCLLCRGKKSEIWNLISPSRYPALHLFFFLKIPTSGLVNLEYSFYMLVLFDVNQNIPLLSPIAFRISDLLSLSL